MLAAAARAMNVLRIMSLSPVWGMPELVHRRGYAAGYPIGSGENFCDGPLPQRGIAPSHGASQCPVRKS
jgi:hypothetical protein